MGLSPCLGPIKWARPAGAWSITGGDHPFNQKGPAPGPAQLTLATLGGGGDPLDQRASNIKLWGVVPIQFPVDHSLAMTRSHSGVGGHPLHQTDGRP